MTGESVFRQPAAPPMTGTELPLDFTAFHQMHREAYVRWSERQLGNRADAEEAVDCAFEHLALEWETVLGMEKPAAYAWQVMKHRTIDVARARGRRPAPADLAAFDTAELRRTCDPIGQMEESLHLFGAIGSLSERQQDVIMMRYGLGYSAATTALHLGITEAGVRSIARQARRRLEHLLNLKGSADDTAAR